MAVGYRSIFSLRRGQDAVRLTAEQLRSWLALKGYGFMAVAPGVHEVAEQSSSSDPPLDLGWRELVRPIAARGSTVSL